MTSDAQDAALEAAAAVHDGVELSRDRFRAFVSERVEGEVAPEIAADLYLACACAEGDARALAIFDAELLGQVPQFLARLDASASLHDEVTQLLRERLFVLREGRRPKIAEYSGRGRLGSWLRVVAIRTALNLKGGKRAVGGAERLADEALAADDPELDYLRQRYRQQFHDAFVSSLQALPPRDRTVLRMHLIDGLNIDSIGQLYDVHRATVARWIAAAREQLFEQTRDHLHAQLGLSETEFASLVRLVRSQLDVSICRILEEQAAPR